MVVASVRNTNNDLVALLKGDFTGKGNFIYWMLSILVIGAVGYIPDLKPVSRAFLALVIIVLFINNRGVFSQFTQAVGMTQAKQPAKPTTSATPQNNPLANAAGVTGAFTQIV